MQKMPKNITKELMEKLYVKEEKSLREIGNLVKKSPVQVSRYLKRFSIQTRPFSTKGLKAWNKGVPMKEESKIKLSESHKGKKPSPEHRAKVIKNLCYGLKGEDNPNWKGGKVMVFSDSKKKKDRVKGTKGYVWLRLPNHPKAYKQGYYPEHRYVMEQKIGRILDKYEHIHHKNGIKDDNRIENLELVNGSTHCLITQMEKRIKELEKENKELREKIN